MPEITTQVCDLTCQSFFKKPVLFRDANVPEVAQKFFDAFAIYGLRPTQIVVRNGDQAFNYDLSISHFNGSGTFKVSAEKLEIVFQNARSPNDFELVQDCVLKAYEQVPLSEINYTLITATAHVVMSTEKEDVEKYLLTFANPSKGIMASGTMAFIKCQNWAQEIRLSIERSLVFPSGLFLTWITTHSGGKLSREVLKSLKEAFEESVTKLDLTFSKRT